MWQRHDRAVSRNPLVKVVDHEKIFHYMLDRLREVAELPDPSGRVLKAIGVPMGCVERSACR